MKTTTWTAATLAIVVLQVVAGKAQSQTTSIPNSLRDVVHYNAPIVIAEAMTPTQLSAYGRPAISVEQMVRVDLDDNNDGSDNASKAVSIPYSLNHTATVYYSAHETGYASDSGYYFLSYYWYHVTDMGFDANIFAYDPGHEHDLEGVSLIVKKSSYFPYGTLIAAVTQAHGALIPWFAHNSSLDNRAAGGGGMGWIENWADGRYNYNWSRPVAVVAARDHATYMAQNCNPAYQSSSWDDGYGMWLHSETSGYTSCVHGDRNVILYWPEMAEAVTTPWAYPQPDTPDPYWVGNGPLTYGLVEVRQSPFWSLANSSGAWFAGNSLTGLHGFTGREHFYASSADVGGGNGANPMWFWKGGTGSCAVGRCYYAFSEDGTSSYHSPASWPTSPYYAQLLESPAAEFAMRFPYLPQMGAPYRYNPYISPAPDYNTPASTLTATITGPNGLVDPYTSYTWQATISGGAAPYTVQWSGVLGGQSSSVTGTVNASGYLYLDVWDANQSHFATSVYVDVNPCPGQPNGC